jgi:hypothetical protein
MTQKRKENKMMSRIRHLASFLILVAVLLWPLTVAAQDPDPITCLELDGKCYASNTVLPGTSTPGNGTITAPWLVDTDQDMQDLHDAISNALADDGYDGCFLAMIICKAGDCQTTWYEYDEDGKLVFPWWTEPGVPRIGVSLPFPYILGSGVILGALLLGIGIVLRRRARI